MLSKKHFKEIASIIQDAREFYVHDDSNRCLDFIQDRMARWLADHNPRFNRVLFTNACASPERKDPS